MSFQNIFQNGKYALLIWFENNLQERKETPAWNKDKELVVNQILENWELKFQFSQDEVFRVEGILDVNTIEYFPCPKTLPNVSGA